MRRGTVWNPDDWKPGDIITWYHNPTKIIGGIARIEGSRIFWIGEQSEEHSMTNIYVLCIAKAEDIEWITAWERIQAISKISGIEYEYDFDYDTWTERKRMR